MDGYEFTICAVENYLLSQTFTEFKLDFIFTGNLDGRYSLLKVIGHWYSFKGKSHAQLVEPEVDAPASVTMATAASTWTITQKMYIASCCQI